MIGKQIRRLPLFGSFRVVEANTVSKDSVFVGASDTRGIVIHDDRLPLAVHVERFGAGLAEAVAGVLHAAKRHVRAGAVGGAVDRHETGAVAGDELLDAVGVARVERAGEAVIARDAAALRKKALKRIADLEAQVKDLLVRVRTLEHPVSIPVVEKVTEAAIDQQMISAAIQQ